MKNRNDWLLFRIIVSAHPGVNIFTRQARKTTALGPVLIATVASKVWGWRVEVIDENNYQGPRDSQGLPDHAVLQRENPASIVGFYCGLTCAMERVWELAEFYHQCVKIIAGGWHAHYCPEETLNHNIDVVVHGDGEMVIRPLIRVLMGQGNLNDIPGISFWENQQVKTTLPGMLENPDLNDLPYPNFGLVRYGKIKLYPIGRVRGCSMKCEFCSVKGEPRWAEARYLFNTVKWLVETRRARHFFIVDDRSEENIEGTIKFFRMISEKYGKQLHFSVQARLEAARNTELLETMERAGVRVVCIGYESPIDKDLRAMRKGYSSSKMIELTKAWSRYFWVHGMFVAGYPPKGGETSINVEETVRCFRRFIRQAHPDTVQILLPVPIPGSDLRERLERERRIFPQEIVTWSKYDGSFPCFKPNNMSARELQEIGLKLMGKFYNRWGFIGIFLRFIVFPIDCFVRGWGIWRRGWRRDVMKYGGHLLLQRWQRKGQNEKFLKKLEDYSKRSP